MSLSPTLGGFVSRLSSKEVLEILKWCLFNDQDRTSQKMEVEGILHKFVLHRGRLAAKRRLIEELLGELPRKFRRSDGDGASFLEACLDHRGEQWTDLHQVMEALFVLGIAIEKVEFRVGREEWRLLPGGMPHLVIDM
jgi:hypothetical protein